MIGAHVSTAGGLNRSLERAVAMKCPVIQIFAQSPRTWDNNNISDLQITNFLKAQSEFRIGTQSIDVYNHASYLINLASPDRTLAVKSTESLSLSLQLCEKLKVKATVVHIGSVKDTPRNSGISRVASNVNRCLSLSKTTHLYLENTAGAGGTLGRSLYELALILENIDDKTRIGICLDTQHLFASGVNYNNFESVELLVKEVTETVGSIQLIHLNDSKVDRASNIDRHENLGKGYIGAKALKLLIGHKYFREIPMILEVPGSSKAGPETSDIRQANAYLKAGIKLWDKFTLASN